METSNGRDSTDEAVIAPKAPSFIAVDKDTGKVAWQDNSPGEAILHGQWASPALAVVNRVAQVIFPGGDGWLYAFNARTGESIWKFDMNPKDAAWPKTRNYGVSTPVFSGGRVSCVGQDPDHPNGVGRTYAIDPGQRGDITGSGTVWQYQNPGADLDGGPRGRLRLRGRYAGRAALPGRRHREAALDLRHDGAGLGIAARGRRRGVLGDQDGDVAVLKAGPQFHKIAEIDMGNSVYSTPVPANGVLYVMTRSELYAIPGPPATKP